MPVEKHPHECDCGRYACELRQKGITTQLQTGRSGPGVTGDLGPRVKQVSRGQDGAFGRDAGGSMI